MPTIGRLRYLEAPPRASADSGRRPASAGPLDAGSPRGVGVLVLIHAFPLNARMWEPQLALADGGWTVIVPQLRGMDGGVGDPIAASIDDYAGDVSDLLDALHVQDAVIGGLSMGGYVALALFRRAPRYFRGMVLADTRSQADTPEGVEGRKRMIALVREKGASAIADEMLPKLLSEATRTQHPEVVERTRALILANPAEAIAGALDVLMTRPDSTPLLKSIHCPTLILVGDHDSVTPPPLSEELHRAIGGSELAIIEGAGHVSSLEQPAAFNTAVARFLEHRV